MTDPNSLYAGNHVHLGPGAIGERVTNPAIDLHELPRMDAVLLSHIMPITLIKKSKHLCAVASQL